MHLRLRKIGNSRGIIIPSSILEQLRFDTEVEMIVEDDALILKPIKRLRENWFNGYDAKNDVEPFEEMKAFDSEHEDWEW